MANKPRGFGLTAELDRKKAEKFDAADAAETMQWIADVLRYGDEEELASGITTVEKPSDVADILKDGKALCYMINIMAPGSVKKIHTNKMAFKQMENIGNFLAACGKIGVAKTDLFQTVDLYESSNIPQVITGLNGLGRKSKTLESYDGPTLGPNESEENKREFTEEQMRAGDGVIGLQAGSNKGASQAGQNFGKTRAIID